MRSDLKTLLVALFAVSWTYVCSAAGSFRGHRVKHRRAESIYEDPSVIERINCGWLEGGSTYQDLDGKVWSSDKLFDGGINYRNDEIVAVLNATDPEIYKTERFGNFKYTIPLSATGKYLIRLYFAEIYFSENNQRIFNVKIGDDPILTEFDILQTFEGQNKAYIKEVTVEVSDFKLEIDFSSIVNNAKVSGIEVIADGENPPPNEGFDNGVNADGLDIISLINCGSEEDTNDVDGNVWSKDTFYSQGLTYLTGSETISNTVNEMIYFSERFGSTFSYNIPVPSSGEYIVKLYFTEIFFETADSRLFNVAIEGKEVLTNFDIIAETGKIDHAIVKTFEVSADDVSISIIFTGVKENAKISGISVQKRSSG